MSKLPYEAFLALRYLRPRRTFVSVITVISIIGVMLGVGVLIVVIAVMSGFDQEWRNRILGFNAHLKVYQRGRPAPPLSDYSRVLEMVAANRHVLGVAPFVQGQVPLKTQPEAGGSMFSAPIMRGVDAELEASVSILPTNIVLGNFDLEWEGLVVGREYAEAMDLRLGDRVAIYSLSAIDRMLRTRGQEDQEAALASEYEVRGIFDVGFSEYNSMFVVTSIENAQQLYELAEDEVHGLQIMLHDPFRADQARSELQAALGRDYQMVTWLEENPYLFDALAVEKNMMFFLLFFIMIVAGFGIVNCQITFVVQKTREIGILKAIGSSNQQVLWLFLSQSIVVGLLGVSLGFGFAMLALAYRNEFLSFMNQMTGFELLPSKIYHIYELPASIQFNDVAVICGTAFITCVLAGLFPAWKASRLQPVEALRHE
jgi:lipoprotein-releasing system permease protein